MIRATLAGLLGIWITTVLFLSHVEKAEAGCLVGDLCAGLGGKAACSGACALLGDNAKGQCSSSIDGKVSSCICTGYTGNNPEKLEDVVEILCNKGSCPAACTAVDCGKGTCTLDTTSTPGTAVISCTCA